MKRNTNQKCELQDLDIHEVSLVGRPAIDRPFAICKAVGGLGGIVHTQKGLLGGQQPAPTQTPEGGAEQPAAAEEAVNPPTFEEAVLMARSLLEPHRDKLPLEFAAQLYEDDEDGGEESPPVPAPGLSDNGSSNGGESVEQAEADFLMQEVTSILSPLIPAGGEFNVPT